jgi:UDPglucose 6-dehydrogenase
MPRTPDQAAAARTIAVLGAGYVGLTTAAGFAHLGHRIRVADADAGRLQDLSEGRIPFSEPGIDELVAAALEAGRISFHADNAEAVAGAEAVFVAVQTPEGRDGSVDLSYVEAALTSIVGAVGGDVPIVVKSSVPPGSAVALRALLRDLGSGSPLVINPEFLQEGHAVENVLHPHRVVVGGDDAGAVALVAELNEPFGAPVLQVDAATAELTKYAANAYLATRITFVNSMAHLAEDVGADVSQVLAGLAYDPRIGGHYLRPGPGYGGSCFHKDLRALVRAAEEHGHDLRMLRTVVETNDAQLDRIISKLADGLGGLAGRTIGLLGLAFKGGTDDVRSSPAVALADRLLDAGARIRAFDPAAQIVREGMELVGDAVAAATGADALLIATEWPQFSDLDLGATAAAMRGRLIVDARNMLDKDAVRAAGFDYRGLGR